MIRARQAEQILKYIVPLVLLAVFAFQVMAQRGLYADGSFQLLNLLIAEAGSAHPSLFHELVTRNNEPSRFFAYLVMELPAVIALRLGVTNMQALIYVFSSWLCFVPLFFWGLALWRLRKDFLFWSFLVMFAAVYFSCNFFIVGEYNLAYALAACCFAYLLKAERNMPADNAILFLTAAASVMSYGSTMFTGPLLAFLSLRKFQRIHAPRARLYWGALAALFIASFGIGIWAYLYPRLPENLQNARDLRGLLYNTQFSFVLAFALLVASQIFLRKKSWRSLQSYLLLGLSVAYLLVPANGTPFLGYSVRAFTALALCGFIAAIGWFALYGRRYALTPGNMENFHPLPHYIAPAFALFVVLALTDINGSLEFRAYLDDFSHEVNTQTGLLPFESSVMLIPNNSLYGWTWTNPTLGLLLRKDEKAAVILDPLFQKGRWRPFDPRNPPDLSRYYQKN